jgi:hypothetical protein
MDGLQELSIPKSAHGSLVEQGVIRLDQLYDDGVAIHVPPEGLAEFDCARKQGSPKHYHRP